MLNMASKPNVLVFSPPEKGACTTVVREIQQEKVISMDAEGIHLSSTGVLTLIQIGTLDGHVYLFDVMKNEKEQDKNFFKDTGLDEILTSSEIVKVIHSCSSDSASLFHQFGIKLNNVFDTQVAHLVIEEQKGRKLPYRRKLAELCRTYSTTAKVYEGKDEVQIEWDKRENDYWAKRPMTQEMIDYASGDVSALIPDVFETQKRYLEENGQMDKFAELVKEEIELDIDPAMKERRKLRRSKAVKSVLNIMIAKYGLGTQYEAVTDEDEIKALKDVSVRDILDYPRVLQNLKYGNVRAFLKELQGDLNNPETFVSPRNLDHLLYDIEINGPEEIRKNAMELRKQVRQVITKDIQRKYKTDTPVEKISETDTRALKNLRPVTADGLADFHPTIIALYWKLEEHDIDVAAKNFYNDSNCDLSFLPKLRFNSFNRHVPEPIKRKAMQLLRKIESKTLANISQVCMCDTPLDQLSETEKTVLRGIRTQTNSFHPTVVSLHWKIIYDGLCKDLDKYKESKLRMNNGLEKKLAFFAKHPSVPSDVKRKAQEVLRYLPRR